MAILLRLLMKAGDGRSALLGWQGEVLRVQVAAPPQAGRANEALLELMAGALGLERAQVKLLRGHRSHHKLMAVEGMEEDEARRRLGR